MRGECWPHRHGAPCTCHPHLAAFSGDSGYNILMDGPGDARLCVFCRRHPVVAAWRPFCSQRCQLQDQARWADGTYRVPGNSVELPDEPDEAPDPDHRRD